MFVCVCIKLISQWISQIFFFLDCLLSVRPCACPEHTGWTRVLTDQTAVITPMPAPRGVSRPSWASRLLIPHISESCLPYQVENDEEEKTDGYRRCLVQKIDRSCGWLAGERGWIDDHAKVFGLLTGKVEQLRQMHGWGRGSRPLVSVCW